MKSNSKQPLTRVVVFFVGIYKRILVNTLQCSRFKDKS